MSPLPTSPTHLVSGDDPPTSHHRAVARALSAMRGEGDEHLPLAALAEIAGFSPFHFSRLFREATGLPPVRFQIALRLERAKQLLLTTDLSVTDVCFAVGYDGLGTFTTRFTSLVGVSPGRLRRLPEEIDAALGRLTLDPFEPASASAPVEPGVLTGRVTSPSGGGPVFVGLFPAGLAAGPPVAGVALRSPGRFRLAEVPDGRYHLLAAALPPTPNPLTLLLPGDQVRVGHAPAPIHLDRGRVVGATDIALRPPLPTEPPVLVALASTLLTPPPGTGRDRR